MKSKRLSLVLLAGLGFLLLIQAGLTVLEENVNAQLFEPSRFMIMVNGTWRDNEEPVFVINAHEQTISVYEYNGETDKLKLVAVRTYRWDRLIQEYNNEPPSVRVIEKQVGRR